MALAEIDGNKYVLHRIINIHGESVTLRGDGNILTESCNLDDIKGIAVGFYRKGREKLSLRIVLNGIYILLSGQNYFQSDDIYCSFIKNFG